MTTGTASDPLAAVMDDLVMSDGNTDAGRQACDQARMRLASYLGVPVPLVDRALDELLPAVRGLVFEAFEVGRWYERQRVSAELRS